MGSRGKEDTWQGRGWGTGWSHIHVWINWEEQLGCETNCATQRQAWGTKASKPQAVKIYGGFSSGRNSQSHRSV